MGTWIWGILAALLIMIGGYIEVSSDHAQEQDRVSYSQAVAGNMLVYRNAVVAYAKAHPTATGSISDLALNMSTPTPAWYHRVTGVSNYVTGGQAWVYYVGAQGGQVADLLKHSGNSVLAGVVTNGYLYNALAGQTQIAVPTAVPNGAVAFAPSALNVAPVPGPPGANCSIASGAALSWTVSGTTCSYKNGLIAKPVSNNATFAVSDTQTVNSGSAAFLCSNGTMATLPQPGATCTPPPPAPCSVASSTTRSWTVSGNSCSGPAGGSSTNTVASGTSWTFTSTNANSGKAGFLCTNGTLATTPDGSQTCAPPANPCVLPNPSTQTNTNTQTATQTLACAAGYTGAITQTQPQQQTQTRTAYCPAATGAPAWGAWSAWSAWSATGPWTTTSNTCVVAPPPLTMSCNWTSCASTNGSASFVLSTTDGSAIKNITWDLCTAGTATACDPSGPWVSLPSCAGLTSCSTGSQGGSDYTVRAYAASSATGAIGWAERTVYDTSGGRTH